MTVKRRRYGTCIALGVLGCCLAGTQSAWGNSLDLERAGDMAGSAASSLGQVQQTNCWRPAVAVRTRARRRAFCVARIRTDAGADCIVFYQVRFAARPSRRVSISRRFAPWCASPPAATAARAALDAREAGTKVRSEADRHGTVKRVSCWHPKRANGTRIRGRLLCAARLGDPSCEVTYEVRSRRRGLLVVPTYVPWCASMPKAL
jgi:hypothetical protein